MGSSTTYTGAPMTAAQWRARIGKSVFDGGEGDYRPRQDQVLADAPPVPDLTDTTVQRAALAQRRRLMAAGTNSTFLTGPTGAGPFTGDVPTGIGG